MISPRALAALLAVAIAAPALPDTRFDALLGSARKVESLGPFLERYVGSCRDEFSRADCERNVREGRRDVDGRVFATSVGQQTLDIVRPMRTSSGYRFVVTPFIDGGGLALTHGEPQKQDAAGRPLIPYVILEGRLPEGMDDLALESALRTGRLELEVLFKPQGTWKLRRKGEKGFYEGMKARFVGVRLLESRSGAELASKVF